MAQKSQHNRNISIVDRQILSEDTPAIDDASTVQFIMVTRAASVGVITVVRGLVAMPLLAGASRRKDDGGAERSQNPNAGRQPTACRDRAAGASRAP
jgi:hypothetical protein